MSAWGARLSYREDALVYLTVIDITMGGLQMIWLWKDSDYLAVLSLAPPFVLGLVRARS